MTDRALLQQALEALEADELDMVPDKNGHMVFRIEVAITALRERLAQPEQEPWPDEPPGHIAGGVQEPVQEPVAWSWEHDERVVNAFPFKPDAEFEYWKAKGWTTRPLVYGDTAQQPRQWQGLTVAQIEEAFQQSAGADEDTHIRFARAIEVKLREKNT